ncbi:MAG TPA: CoA transferase, partial [Candidatus Binataceae bacterium]|nr:CoA transferase [Candidatus Binataceae bacterium]
MTSGQLPLAGVRVLDFTWVVAGPVATRILADQGAEVVKVERKVPPQIGDRKRGLLCELHRDKLSVAINMSHPDGLELARKLARKSDLVMDNFSARVMKTWGMDYESLSRINPGIICISMSGLGHTGPRSSYVSYGPTLQALGGYTQLMAEESGEPAGYGYSYADMAGGYTGALAALIALYHKRRSGQGQFVDLSQFEAVVSVVGPALLDIDANDREQQPPHYNSQEGPAAPHGVYRCAPLDRDDDRWVAIGCHSQGEWERLVGAIGAPAWTSEAKFATLYLRMKNRADLDAHLTRWTRERSAEEVMMLLQRAKVPAGVVANGADICARDPQLKERGYWASVKRADGEDSRIVGIPFKMSSTPASVRSIAPEVGENTDHVLGEILGLTRA